MSSCDSGAGFVLRDGEFVWLEHKRLALVSVFTFGGWSQGPASIRAWGLVAQSPLRLWGCEWPHRQLWDTRCQKSSPTVGHWGRNNSGEAERQRCRTLNHLETVERKTRFENVGCKTLCVWRLWLRFSGFFLFQHWDTMAYVLFQRVWEILQSWI